MTGMTGTKGQRGWRLAPLGIRLRALARRYVSMIERDQLRRAGNDPYAGESPDYEVESSPYRLGVLREFFHYHKSYLSACRELGISYRLLDISGNDWIGRLRQSKCDGFLVWPSVARRVWREMFDERLWIMEHELGMLVYPTYRETWLYESKRRVREWLVANNVPHPQTWIFFERAPALEFAMEAPLPIVLKTNLGASHSGVWIIRSRAELQRRVSGAFGSGILARGRHRSEGEAGYTFLQRYLPEVREWRMVRIGDSYFGHPKGRAGDFHSGSGIVEWTPPEARHLDFLKKVTDLGGFTSMAVDVFETQDGELLVNELQTVFGAGFSVDQARVDGRPGRLIQHNCSGSWQFEEGDFARNACANARVQYFVQQLARRSAAPIRRHSADRVAPTGHNRAGPTG
ncbi:MAG: RimK family alpha-L-glutamate ligase [Verrucomicrobiia bacterium]